MEESQAAVEKTISKRWPVFSLISDHDILAGSYIFTRRAIVPSFKNHNQYYYFLYDFLK